MIARFYNYTGERNRLDKSSALALLYEVDNFYLKATSNVDDLDIRIVLPRFEGAMVVDGNGNDIVTSGGDSLLTGDLSPVDFMNINYVYLDGLKSYYFVTSRAIENNTILILSLSIDLLMSHKDDIIGLTLFCSRAEQGFNPALYDSFRPTASELAESRYDLPLNGNITFSKDFSETDNHIILSTLINPYYDLEWTDPDRPYRHRAPLKRLSDITTNILGESERIDPFPVSQGANSMQYYAVSEGYVTRLANILFINQSVDNFVVSIVAFPFDLSGFIDSSDTSFVLAGNGEDNGIYPYRVGDSSANLPDYDNLENYRPRYHYGGIIPPLVLSEFRFLDSADNDYHNLEPYCSYEIYIPFYGYVPVSASGLKGHWLKIFYTLSTMDGSGTAYLYDDTAKMVIFSANVQVGFKIELTKSNLTQLRNLEAQKGISLLINYLSGIVSIGANASTGNAFGVGASLVNLAGNTAQTIQAVSQMIPTANVNVGQPSSSIFGSYKPYVRRIAKIDTFPSSDFFYYDRYLHLYGRPLNEYIEIRYHIGEGFKVFNASSSDLDGINATIEEKTAIADLLKAGIYI